MTFQPEFLPKDEAIMAASDHPTDDIMVSFDPSKCYSKCADKSCETMTCCSLEKEDDDNDAHSHGALSKGDCKSSRGNTHCKSSRNHHHVHHHHEEERCLVSPSSDSSVTECSLSPDHNLLTSFTWLGERGMSLLDMPQGTSLINNPFRYEVSFFLCWLHWRL